MKPFNYERAIAGDKVVDDKGYQWMLQTSSGGFIWFHPGIGYLNYIFNKDGYHKESKIQLYMADEEMKSSEHTLEYYFSMLMYGRDFDDLYDHEKRNVENAVDECKEYAEKMNADLIAENERLKSKYDISESNKEITGFDTAAEWHAYNKGREDEEKTIFKFIEEWNGETNSTAGQILYDKLKSVNK